MEKYNFIDNQVEVLFDHNGPPLNEIIVEAFEYYLDLNAKECDGGEAYDFER